MEVQAIKDESGHYIDSVKYNNGLLTWKSNLHDEEYFLIVKSEFGKPLQPERNLISDLKGLPQLSEGREIALSNGMTVYLYRKKNNIIGYSCPKRPARYSVFVCEYLGDKNKIKLYTKSCCVDVSYEIRLKCAAKEVKYGSLFRKKTKTVISISAADGTMPLGYLDGALFYVFSGIDYRYPITERMLKNGFKLISPNGIMPEIRSNSMGFAAIMTNGVYINGNSK